MRPFYFVTFCTHQRRPVLASTALLDAFLQFARIAHVEHDIQVGRYVIMPDHIHLFVALPQTGPPLDRWIGQLKRFLGKPLLNAGLPRPHWQQGFFDHLMRSSDSYDQKWAYVRENPVRAKLCAQPEAWLYAGEIVPLAFGK